MRRATAGKYCGYELWPLNRSVTVLEKCRTLTSQLVNRAEEFPSGIPYQSFLRRCRIGYKRCMLWPGIWLEPFYDGKVAWNRIFPTFSSLLDLYSPPLLEKINGSSFSPIDRTYPFNTAVRKKSKGCNVRLSFKRKIPYCMRNVIVKRKTRIIRLSLSIRQCRM